jgi:hypothetical protein
MQRAHRDSETARPPGRRSVPRRRVVSCPPSWRLTSREGQAGCRRARGAAARASRCNSATCPQKACRPRVGERGIRAAVPGPEAALDGDIAGGPQGGQVLAERRVRESRVRSRKVGELDLLRGRHEQPAQLQPGGLVDQRRRSRAKGAPSRCVDIVIPDPGPGRGGRRRSRPAGCATPTCTTARAASTTTSRSCSATRRRASSRRSAPASPTWRRATSWSSTGAPCAASAGPATGPPQYCFATHNATQKMTLTDGTELSPALGIGAFAEKTLVAAGQATKVDPSPDPRRRRAAGLRRDGGPGRGHVHRRGRPGDSVAVFGCGGVGDAAIAGARLIGASKIIAVDLDAASWTWPRSSAPPTP